MSMRTSSEAVLQTVTQIQAHTDALSEQAMIGTSAWPAERQFNALADAIFFRAFGVS